MSIQNHDENIASWDGSVKYDSVNNAAFDSLSLGAVDMNGGRVVQADFGNYCKVFESWTSAHSAKQLDQLKLAKQQQDDRIKAVC